MASERLKIKDRVLHIKSYCSRIMLERVKMSKGGEDEEMG